MMGYATLYTSLPVFSLVLDRDVSEEACLKYPPLYKTLQMGRSLNAKTLMIWFWKSVFQGCVIMLGAIMCFKESFTNIVTITFSALIIIELLNVYSSVNTVNWKMIASSVMTFVMYVISIVCLRSYFDTSYMTW